MNLDIQSTIPLLNGVQMPRFGLGTARMTEVEVVSRAVQHALQTGYRLVDTSKNYENEEPVGLGIRKSGLAENDVFLTTKLEEEDYGTEGVKHECISVWGNDRRMQAHPPIIPPNYPQSEIHPNHLGESPGRYVLLYN
jgi:aryl-alcohol dehydrogenase-like predicted oxidoreductase